MIESTKRVIYTDPDGDTITWVHEQETDTVEGGDFLSLRQGVKFLGSSLAATVALPTTPAARLRFVKELAAALDVDVEITAPRAEGVCVSVAPPFPGETDWHVVGDIYDGLSGWEIKQAFKLVKGEDGDSLNYTVARILRENPGLGFNALNLDPESSCFFAYPKTEAEARELAEWINSKGWIKGFTNAE